MVAALAVLPALGFMGCSSSQDQASEQIEVSDEQGGQESDNMVQQEGQQQGQEYSEEVSQEVGDNMNVANSEMGSNNLAMNDGSNMEATESLNSADSDVQQMISEMNGAAGNAAGAVTQNETVANAVAEEVPAEATPVGNNAAPVAEQPAAAPTETVASSALPEMGSKMPYVVEHGDTLGKIATKVYGDQTKWREIASLTSLSNPNRVYPGDVVYYKLDDSSVNFAQVYDSIPRASEIVREGDTLASIAKRVYGSGNAWKHIWRQNDSITDPDKLTAGMTIYYLNKGAVQAAVKKIVRSIAKVAKNIETNIAHNIERSGDSLGGMAHRVLTGYSSLSLI
jgi:nucleoid-associated protein YgaU